MRGHTLNKKYSWYINWIHAKTFIALIKMTCQDLNALVCSILKVFWDWTFCHIREVEIGQFSLTTIYTIYTWIKINILNGQRFYSSLLLERIRIILIVHDPSSTSQKHFSCQMYSSIMMGYLQKNNRKKCLLSSLLHLKLLILVAGWYTTMMASICYYFT